MHHRLLVTSIMILFASLSASAPVFAQKYLNAEDSAALLAAIEDYNFSDYELAIEKLEKLSKQYPDNRRVLKYLGLTYEESGNYEGAIGMYFRWLSQEKLAFTADARFAHLGIAKSYAKLDKDEQALKQLENWMVFHPDDQEVQVMRAETLVRLKEYTKARTAWQKITGLKGLKAEQKAAAHYYLSLIAYHLGETEESRLQGETAIQVQPAGAYAEPARKLVQMRPKYGWYTVLGIEEFYTDNVELLPDYMPITGRDNADYATRASANVSYNFSEMGIGYRFSGTRYSKRSDFNLDTHILNATIPIDDGMLSPRYEYARLSSDFLYHGIGLDFNWRQKQWTFGVGAVYKKFNDNFSIDPNLAASDLSYLDGLSANLSAIRQGVTDDLQHYFSVGLSGESTKGNVTHDKAGNYLQLQFAAGVTKAMGEFSVGTSADAHYRKYESADPLASGLVRADNFLQLQAFATWNPWDNQQRFVLSGSWQRNSSNYNQSNVPLILAKEFEAIKTSLSWNYKW